ncbi:MAG: HAD-IA family hydrolase [Chroococcidiopsidaceae cyanobacterium CP_BM_ER_R8_30]|nr:HAD-IA family hydrolase [Chroococcidiopsidaceae cyanobacterium CP_BM_ER_R8_30]
MAAKVIIFDFDGTIADTISTIVAITNSLAGKFGYRPITSDELVELKNLNSHQILQYSGISNFKLPFVVRKIKAELNREIQVLKPIRDMQATLTELKVQDRRLGIVTSNSKKNVTSFLRSNNLCDLFDFIHSNSTLFGKDKVIKRILNLEKLALSEVVYVGDETRDIEVAKKLNIKAIAVSWGFSSREVLAKYNPDFLIHHPSELIKAVRDLESLKKI